MIESRLVMDACYLAAIARDRLSEPVPMDQPGQLNNRARLTPAAAERVWRAEALAGLRAAVVLAERRIEEEI